MVDSKEVAKRKVRIPAEDVPVIAEADVVVVGGGTSGFIAATAAARSGARTILVERFGYLGGCTTAPYNTGLGSFGDSDGNQIIRGLAWEFLERMQREGQCLVKGFRPQLWPPWTKKVALDMIEEAGVDLYFYTWVAGVVQKDGAIQGLDVVNKGGRAVILARSFVDASGDADLAAFAGAPFEMSDIDDLQQVVEANLRQRRREALRAEEIVEREVDRLLGRLKRLEVAPTIAALQEHLHGLRQQELERARLRDLSPEQRTAVEEMTRRLVNKILHGPIAELKRLPQEPDGLKLTEFARRLFRLKE